MLVAKFASYLIAFVLLTPQDDDALCWQVVAKINSDANDFVSALSLIIELFILALRFLWKSVEHVVLVLKFKFIHRNSNNLTI